MISAGLLGSVSPLFVGIPGGLELAILLLVVVMLFGPNKLPQLARSVGKAEAEFTKSRREATTEVDELRQPSTVSADSGNDSVRDLRVPETETASP